MPDEIRTPYVELTQHDKSFILTKISVSNLVKISYASVRGLHSETGAVQRILNVRRISAIKDFTLAGGHYPASIVLNWITEKAPLTRDESGNVVLPVVDRAAQIIDGQHRVAGLRAALEEDPHVDELQIPVAIYTDLTTKECADIFLSINTEQKPVPKTLVFDLYGIADESIVDKAAARARDIAIALNDDEDSPYYDQIKLPGAPQRKGGIALSTAVTALKPLVEEKGEFEQRGIHELEVQKKIVKNFFGALSELYGNKWSDRTNAFMYASGFSGGIDFLKTKLLVYGQKNGKYTKETFVSVIEMTEDDLILQEEVKGKGGKDAPLLILDRLNNFFKPAVAQPEAIEV
ncbi:DGQHR domain-containing protein [Methylorubrum extorquens]|uniref:DGQHR domain-containing protein n=1 Tax=Methylorubrum extorquens TaxID=408 RepID=UPI000DBE984D|nr:DGQHR domain-containing protein [Methylorubrum extorquens]